MQNFVRRHWAHVTGWVAVITLVTTLGVADALPGRNTVDSGDIINGQVKSADIQNGGVKPIDIRNGAVRTAKIFDNAVNGAKVADGSLTGADIADGTLDGLDIVDQSLNGNDIADGSIRGAEIAANAVESIHVKNNSLTGADIAENTLNLGGANMGCNAATAKAWAYVDVSGNGAGLPDINKWQTRTTAYLPADFNCNNGAGNGVQMMREPTTGFWRVYFASLGTPWIVQVTVEDSGGLCDRTNATVNRMGLTGQYQIKMRDVGGTLRDCDFIVTVH